MHGSRPRFGHSLSLSLAIALAFGAAGCGDGDADDSGPNSTTAGSTLADATDSGAGGSDTTGGSTTTGGGTTAADCTDPPSFAAMTLWDKCTSCHSSTLSGLLARQAAPAGVDFDTYDAAAANAQGALAKVEQGTMPPARTNNPLTDEEKAELAAWVACGTPE